MDNNDLYIIYLNSSNTGMDKDGTPILATNDSDFTTTIRPLNLNPDSNWVVGVVDINFYGLLNNPSAPTNSEYQPVNLFSDIGIQVRNGEATTDKIYTTKPPTIPTANLPQSPLYYGEKNTSSIVGWRPIQNKSIQQISTRFIAFDGTPVQWNGTGIRGFNSVTFAIMKVQ